MPKWFALMNKGGYVAYDFDQVIRVGFTEVRGE